jgi:phosphatidylinositol kinase/protein kinase (PI-3  family)
MSPRSTQIFSIRPSLAARTSTLLLGSMMQSNSAASPLPDANSASSTALPIRLQTALPTPLLTRFPRLRIFLFSSSSKRQRLLDALVHFNRLPPNPRILPLGRCLCGPAQQACERCRE